MQLLKAESLLAPLMPKTWHECLCIVMYEVEFLANSPSLF